MKKTTVVPEVPREAGEEFAAAQPVKPVAKKSAGKGTASKKAKKKKAKRKPRQIKPTTVAPATVPTPEEKPVLLPVEEQTKEEEQPKVEEQPQPEEEQPKTEQQPEEEQPAQPQKAAPQGSIFFWNGVEKVYCNDKNKKRIKQLERAKFRRVTRTYWHNLP